MREDTVTTKVYPFDELSDEAKQTATSRLWDINVDYEWWNGVFYDAETIGLEIKEFDISRSSFCRGTWTENAEDTAALILENHGEACETRIDADRFLENIAGGKAGFESSDDYDPEYEEFGESDEYGELCEEFQQMICEDYRIILQKDYEYLISEKAIIETIEANEYEFTADGKMY